MYFKANQPENEFRHCTVSMCAHLTLHATPESISVKVWKYFFVKNSHCCMIWGGQSWMVETVHFQCLTGMFLIQCCFFQFWYICHWVGCFHSCCMMWGGHLHCWMVLFNAVSFNFNFDIFDFSYFSWMVQTVHWYTVHRYTGGHSWNCTLPMFDWDKAWGALLPSQFT